MNPPPPEARAHGEAWRAFANYLQDRRPSVGPLWADAEWRAFLAGWLAKAKQQDVLRGRR